jgi:uncharacterized membrane protein
MVFDVIFGFATLAITLFVPGYFVSLAFFARKNEIDWIERITLSFVMSISLLPLLVLFENLVLKIPINIYSVGGALAFLILAGLLTYLWRTRVPNPPALCKKLLPPVPKEDAVPIIPKLK